MQVIKLDAIDSTNDFLKAIAAAQNTENFTVVTAENQTKGKGQMGAKWLSEVGKNLTMSVLVKGLLSDINQIYSLNSAVALSIVEALEPFQIPKLSIKWPNDIMADHKKIGGILIENSIKSNGEILSIVGIGLNVNQQNFEGLPKASSLSIAAGTEFDKAQILEQIVERMKVNTAGLLSGQAEILWEKYLQKLFKKGIPMAFEATFGAKFMGIIQDVSKEGKLVLLLEDDNIKTYGIKEIQMLY